MRQLWCKQERFPAPFLVDKKISLFLYFTTMAPAERACFLCALRSFLCARDGSTPPRRKCENSLAGFGIQVRGLKLGFVRVHCEWRCSSRFLVQAELEMPRRRALQIVSFQFKLFLLKFNNCNWLAIHHLARWVRFISYPFKVSDLLIQMIAKL